MKILRLYELVGFKWYDCMNPQTEQHHPATTQSAIVNTICQGTTKESKGTAQSGTKNKLVFHLTDYIPPVGYAYWIKKIDLTKIYNNDNKRKGKISIYKYALRDRSQVVGRIAKEMVDDSDGVILRDLWVAEAHRRHRCGVEEALIRDAVGEDKYDESGRETWPDEVDRKLETIKVELKASSDDTEVAVVTDVFQRLGFFPHEDDENGVAVFKRQRAEGTNNGTKVAEVKSSNTPAVAA